MDVSCPPTDQVSAFETFVSPWPTELEIRDSTPPDAFKAIIASLAAIPAGHPQFLRSRSEPQRLLEALAAAGVTVSTRVLPDGTWQTILRRPAGASVLSQRAIETQAA